MQVLTIGPAELAMLDELIAYAEANRWTDERMSQSNAASAAETIAGLTPYCRDVPDGVRILFTIEQDVDTWMRHLTLSVKNSLPSIELAETVLGLLGFKGGLDNCTVHLNDEGSCVSIYQPMS